MTTTQVDPAVLSERSERVEALNRACTIETLLDPARPHRWHYCVGLYEILPDGQFRDDLWDALTGRNVRSALRAVAEKYGMLTWGQLPCHWIHNDEPVDPCDVVASEPEHRRDR